MRKISDFWVDYYLNEMRTIYQSMSHNREFSELQLDKITKTLDSFKNKLKENEK